MLMSRQAFEWLEPRLETREVAHLRNKIAPPVPLPLAMAVQVVVELNEFGPQVDY